MAMYEFKEICMLDILLKKTQLNQTVNYKQKARQSNPVSQLGDSHSQL